MSCQDYNGNGDKVQRRKEKQVPELWNLPEGAGLAGGEGQQGVAVFKAERAAGQSQVREGGSVFDPDVAGAAGEQGDGGQAPSLPAGGDQKPVSRQEAGEGNRIFLPFLRDCREKLHTQSPPHCQFSRRESDGISGGVVV